MKCPKCSYNSFECNDLCPKCANDLTRHKQTFGITTLVLSPASRQELLAQIAPEKASTPAMEAAVEAVPETDFVVVEQEEDIPVFATTAPDTDDQATLELTEQASATDQSNDNPFAFLDSTAQKPEKTISFDDPFADLLETTTHIDETPPPLPMQENPLQEAELDPFIFNEEPVANEETTQGISPSAEDELASLFGELDLEAK